MTCQHLLILLCAPVASSIWLVSWQSMGQRHDCAVQQSCSMYPAFKHASMSWLLPNNTKSSTLALQLCTLLSRLCQDHAPSSASLKLGCLGCSSMLRRPSCRHHLPLLASPLERQPLGQETFQPGLLQVQRVLLKAHMGCAHLKLACQTFLLQTLWAHQTYWKSCPSKVQTCGCMRTGASAHAGRVHVCKSSTPPGLYTHAADQSCLVEYARNSACSKGAAQLVLM